MQMDCPLCRDRKCKIGEGGAAGSRGGAGAGAGRGAAAVRGKVVAGRVVKRGTRMNRRLAALANAHGVSTWYEDWRHRRVEVAPETVVGVLGLLGVDATSPAAIADALAAARAVDRSALPETVVLAHGHQPGTARPGCRHPGGRRPPRGRRRAAGGPAAGLAPAGLRRPRGDAGGGAAPSCRCRRAPGVGCSSSTRSPRSAPGAWATSATSPSSPGGPVTPARGWCCSTRCTRSGRRTRWPASPYSPASRRFVNPLYLRVSDTAAYRAADPATRAVVDALRPDRGDLIDYDEVWAAKRRALELLHPYAQPVDLAADPALTSFATWCALAERHGNDWRAWPAELHHPDAPAVAEQRRRLADRVAFHAWLQHLCDEQLDAVTAAARAAGMPVGVVHDLAVGIDPGGADGWQLADVLAQGVRVGAPPDDFNQLGQDWGLAAVAPRPARRHRVRRLPGHAAPDPAARRWPAGRPRRRPVAAVVGAAGRRRGRGHLRALRRRGDARHPRAGGAPGRRGGGRGGSRHGPTGGDPRAARAQHARLDSAVVRPRRGTATFVPPARWPRNALATHLHPRPAHRRRAS